MVPRLALALAASATFFTVVSAQLKVLSPGGSNEWWIANSENLLTWNCDESQEQTFTVLVANPSNPNMPSALAIIAQQPNYVCSLLVTADQMGGLPVGTGYVVQLANPFNSTDIFAASSPFEIKALGNAYPTTTPSETATVTSSGSTNSASTAGSPKSNDGASLKSSLGYATAFFGAIAGAFVL